MLPDWREAIVNLGNWCFISTGWFKGRSAESMCKDPGSEESDIICTLLDKWKRSSSSSRGRAALQVVFIFPVLQPLCVFNSIPGRQSIFYVVLLSILNLNIFPSVLFSWPPHLSSLRPPSFSPSFISTPSPSDSITHSASTIFRGCASLDNYSLFHRPKIQSVYIYICHICYKQIEEAKSVFNGAWCNYKVQVWSFTQSAAL